MTTTHARQVVVAGGRLVSALVTMEVDHLHQVHEPALTAGQHRELEAAVRRRLQHAVRSWLSLPDPEPFERGYDQLRDAAHALNTNEALITAPRVATYLFSDIDGQIDYVRDKLKALEGEAVEAFRTGYLTPLPTVVQGQCALTAFLGSVLLAEKRLVLGAARDVPAVVEAAVGLAQAGSGTVAVPLRTAQATVGAASSFVNGTRTGGQEAAGILLGPLGGLLPAGPVGAVQVELSGARWFDVLESVERALGELGRTLGAGEVALVDACTAAAGVVATHAELFDLASPTALLKTTDPAQLGGGTRGDDLRNDLRLMTDLGRVQVPAIAGILGGAADHLDDVLPGPSWRRPDGVGLAPTGPHDAWAQLLRTLRGLVDDTRHELLAAGEHLVIAGRLIDESDHQVREELVRHASATRRDQEPVPAGRAATPVPGPDAGEPSRQGHFT